MKSKYLISLLFVSILLSCENSMEEVKSVTSDNAPLTERAEDIEIIYSEAGNVKAKLTAPELLKNRAEKPYTEFKKGVSVQMYNDDLVEVSTLNANYAIKYENDEETIVRNKVVVTNINGDRLETEELLRNDKTGELKTTEFVTITTATETIYGMGLQANEDFSWYRIDSMTGMIQVKDNELLDINE